MTLLSMFDIFSELAFHPVRPAVLPYTMNAEYRVHKAEKPAHLIVLVHGLEGGSDSSVLCFLIMCIVL